MTRVSRDLSVVGAFLASLVFLLLIDQANTVIIQSFAIGLFLVAGAHLTRRMLFHQVDLQKFANHAASEPIGAAMVYAATLAFLSWVMWLGITVLK